jgi:uncharacterized protein (UPF0276 family)
MLSLHWKRDVSLTNTLPLRHTQSLFINSFKKEMAMFCKPSECLGVGVNFRNNISDDLIRHLNHFDFIEVMTERFFLDENNPNIANIIKEKPIVLHGVTMATDARRLRKLGELLKHENCRWFSEHITAPNHVGEMTDESVDLLIHQAKKLMSISNKPFLLENIAYYYSMLPTKRSEAKFISHIVEEADCGILLDLYNLYVNAYNYRFDPYDFIHQIPQERIVEIHIASFQEMDNLTIDSYATPIRKDVFSFLDYLCARTPINGVVVEWDEKLNHFSDLLYEVDVVRDILRRNKIL